MRIRATVAAVSGALALSALAVPAATAADEPSAPNLSPFVANAPSAAGASDTKVTKVVVNGGKDIVVGTTKTKFVKVAVTLTDPDGIKDSIGFLWHGSDFETKIDGAITPPDGVQDADCVKADETTSTCTIEIIANPKDNIYGNVLAGKWKVAVGAVDGQDNEFFVENFQSHSVKRAAKLTTNASPEPVKKGKTLTVTGALTRANWDTSKYAGYTKQDVKLQYKKKGTSSYTTLKTVKSDTKGNLKTTVTASADGYYRYVFAGTSTTPAVTSTSDFVDVQ
ncbi:calcium-binding protein [Streptomyces sp. NPDC041068]|uniref:calcium-binding protein n=1 Tax=Streptomyces sp. NPDC041068 TaxID=3155130 RepID=UPI00340D17CB